MRIKEMRRKPLYWVLKELKLIYSTLQDSTAWFNENLDYPCCRDTRDRIRL